MRNAILFTVVFLFIFLFFTGCKTNCWVMTQSDPIVYNDTLVLNSIHYHYRDMEMVPHCVWIDEERIPFTDTIHAKFYSWQKTRPCNCAQ